MAVKILYFLNTTAASPNWFGSMQDGGSAPTAANSTAGWSVAKTAVTTPFFRGRWGATSQANIAAASSYIAGTSGPAKGTGVGVTTAGDSFVSPTAYSGTFAAGAWTLTVTTRPTVATVTGRLRMRVWASANADGTSARELTSGALVGSTNTQSSTTTDYAAGFTWSPGAITLTNEFLFFQIEWEETVAGTSNSSATGLRLGVAAITTTNFTLAAVSGTLVETEDPDVAAVAGSVAWLGSLAETEDADAASFGGSVAWLGTLDATDDVDVADVAGEVLAAGVSGAFSPLEDADVVAIPGMLTGTFLDADRTSAHITLSNSNLTATRLS